MLYTPSVSSFGSVADEKRDTDACAENIKNIDTKVAMKVNRRILLQSNRKMKITSLDFCFFYVQQLIYYTIFILKCQQKWFNFVQYNQIGC